MRRLLAVVLAMAIPLSVAAGIAAILFRFAVPRPLEPTPLATREAPTAAVAPSATLAPTATVLPPEIPQPTATPRPSATREPTMVPTVAPTATPTPTQTRDPTATAQPTPSEIPPTPDLTVYGEVVPFALNLRSGPPGTEFQILQALQKGDRLEVIAQAPDGIWLQVIAPDGTEGWVNSEHVAAPDGAIEGLPVVELAPSG